MFWFPLALAAPVADVPRGIQDHPFSVHLSGSGGLLYYSTDLSSPSLPYQDAIPVSGTTVLRIAEDFEDGHREESTYTYLFVEDVKTSPVMDPQIVQSYDASITKALRELPSVSLVNPSGIGLEESAISLEWMDPAGDSLQLGAGAYVSGGTSWQYEKTSFRLTFRSEYGPGNLEADIYGPDVTGIPAATRFDVLSLRGGNHDTVFYLGARGQHIRNFWMDETQLEQGHLAPHGRFANVYRNGMYHGLYHVRERFNAATMAEYLGGSEDDYEAINAGTAFDGSGATWAALVAASNHFAEARRYLDVEDYLDYMVLNYYAGNAWDWYYWHNWQAAGPAAPDQGGFRFHSSDSDICLTYPWDVNILSLGGPSNLFLNLMAEGDPDFQIALSDAIYRNLTGPLSAEQAAARYERLAALAYDGLAAESARWGYGWWERDDEWVTERDSLLQTWFPYRTDEMWRQFRAAGWYPVEAPEVDVAPGIVAAGTEIQVTVPQNAAPGTELYIRVDGGDPRESGGAVAPEAAGPFLDPTVIQANHSRMLQARLKIGDQWGPVLKAEYVVEETTPILLNEWNVVDPEDWLGGESGTGEDVSLGRIQGNGGDWIELLVTQDLDLRGWRIEMESLRGPEGRLRFSDAPLLAEVKAGTIITIAEDLPEDTSYDPAAGDWRFHLRAGPNGSGRFISAAPFTVNAANWQLSLYDAEGYRRFGPVGEGISPLRGLSTKEAGALLADPSPQTRADSPDYRSVTHSTFGLPNEDGTKIQDLSGLRGETGRVVELQESDPPSPQMQSSACGCGGGEPWYFSALLPLFLRRRRT